MARPSDARAGAASCAAPAVTLFLCGDVMTGRGIDQVLPHPGPEEIFEPWMRSASGYVDLAEAVAGPIPRPVSFDYIWGDVIGELVRRQPQARIINLETAITAADDYWPDKGIHYRMSPANLPCLTAATIDACVLANNHVLDWGYRGLADTLHALREAGIRTTGAGADAAEAGRPATIALPAGRRIVLFGFATASSGVPRQWAATPLRAGVNLLEDLSAKSLAGVVRQIDGQRRSDDLVVVSIHWGGNWGYPVPPEHRHFAHGLIDSGAVHLVHGHSSHHPLGIEVYRGHLILYGCGDLINDYEGIGGYEQFRPELTFMYLPVLGADNGELRRLELVPLQRHRLRLQRAAAEAANWLAERLTREGRPFGTRVKYAADRGLLLDWVAS